MEFINWGNESSSQLEARQRAEREWQALVEQAVNTRLQRSQSVTTTGGVGGGSISGDDTTNRYVENGYVENYLQ